MVTDPGAWGPWVDGGAWLRIDDTAVDWIYRNVDRVRVRVCWQQAQAQAGRFAFHAQVGHPLGWPDSPMPARSRWAVSWPTPPVNSGSCTRLPVTIRPRSGRRW